jgi:hypothetical protein
MRTQKAINSAFRDIRIAPLDLKIRLWKIVSCSPPWEADNHPPNQEYPHVLCNTITVFKRTRFWTLVYVEFSNPIPYFHSTYSSQLNLDIPSVFFTDVVYDLLMASLRATCPAHFIPLDLGALNITNLLA